jgi:hypothetical protein
MHGTEGLTAAKFDTNIRALRGTVMGLPVSNPSTESDFYAGLPTGANVVATWASWLRTWWSPATR